MSTRTGLTPHQLPGRGLLTNRLRRPSTRQWLAILVGVIILAVSIAGLVANQSYPNVTNAQNQKIAALEHENAILSAPVFPADSVRTPAFEQTWQCLNFSDQLNDSALSALEAACGWNGTGVANLQVLQPDTDPNLQPATSPDGYTALPFIARFLGSTAWLTYWVPVQQTGPKTAQVAGMGAPLVSPPTFVTKGCPANTTASGGDSNPYAQAVDSLVAGQPRFALPGHNLPFDGNGLTGAVASNETVCQGSGNGPMVLATVTWNGPTAGATLQANIAFQTVTISDGEVRVGAIGLNLSRSSS